MAERTVQSQTELATILNDVTFAPSCVDMGWDWAIDPMYQLAGDRSGAAVCLSGWNISTTFRRPDRDTGEVATGRGRAWFVAYGATESAVVKTAFAAAKLILEHELLEAFRYRGVRIFDPHHTVDELGMPTRAREEAGRG